MITLFIGKSASGKDTMLKQKVAAGVTPIISYTTRPMREGEKQGVDYNFITWPEFKKLIEKEALTEFRSYKTLIDGKEDVCFYGTPLLELDTEKDYAGVVTISGVEAFIRVYGPENINVVYMQVNDDIREKRAMKRGSFNEIEWMRRLKADEDDFSEGNLQRLEQKLGKCIRVINNNEDRR